MCVLGRSAFPRKTVIVHADVSENSTAVQRKAKRVVACTRNTLCADDIQWQESVLFQPVDVILLFYHLVEQPSVADLLEEMEPYGSAPEPRPLPCFSPGFKSWLC